MREVVVSEVDRFSRPTKVGGNVTTPAQLVSALYR